MYYSLGYDARSKRGLRILLQARFLKSLHRKDSYGSHRSGILLALNRFGLSDNILVILQKGNKPLDNSVVVVDAHLYGGSIVGYDNLPRSIQRRGIRAYARPYPHIRNLAFRI